MSADCAKGNEASVMRASELTPGAAASLLASYGLQFETVADGEAIPGSYWGEPEAGVIGNTVYARADTPVHSLLHEACHLIVIPEQHRAGVHTDASDSIEEEDATCYLQILLAEALPGMNHARMCMDMDAWGYSFRLGSAHAWFEHDAADAHAFLQKRGLPHVSSAGNPHNFCHSNEDGRPCVLPDSFQPQQPA